MITLFFLTLSSHVSLQITRLCARITAVFTGNTAFPPLLHVRNPNENLKVLYEGEGSVYARGATFGEKLTTHDNVP